MNDAMKQEAKCKPRPKRRQGRPETRVLKIKGTPEQVAKRMFAVARSESRR